MPDVLSLSSDIYPYSESSASDVPCANHSQITTVTALLSAPRRKSAHPPVTGTAALRTVLAALTRSAAQRSTAQLHRSPARICTPTPANAAAHVLHLLPAVPDPSVFPDAAPPALPQAPFAPPLEMPSFVQRAPGASARAVSRLRALRAALEASANEPRALAAALEGAAGGVVERAVAEAGVAVVGAGRARVLEAVERFVEGRVVGAASGAAEECVRVGKEREWGRVALVAGSGVAERAAGALGAAVVVVDALPEGSGRACARRLAGGAVGVRYGVLAGAGSLLDGVDVLLVGAEEVAMNGAVVVGAGTGALAAIAADKGVPVVVVAQSVKFSDSMVVGLVSEQFDVLRPAEVAFIVTEVGLIAPAQAPAIARKLTAAALPKK